MKNLSPCGKICFVITALVLIILSSVSFGAIFWSVSFRKCFGTETDFYYSMHLYEGFCFDTTETTSDFDTCTSWEDMESNSLLPSEAQDDAGAYIDTSGLCKTALTFSCVLLLLMVCNFFVPEKILRFVRFGQVGVAAFVTLMFVAAIAMGSGTYYTDLANYGDLDVFCSSGATFPNAGWVSVLLGVIVGGSTVLALLIPSCGCAEKDVELTQTLNVNVVQDTK